MLFSPHNLLGDLWRKEFFILNWRMREKKEKIYDDCFNIDFVLRKIFLRRK